LFISKTTKIYGNATLDVKREAGVTSHVCSLFISFYMGRGFLGIRIAWGRYCWNVG